MASLRNYLRIIGALATKDLTAALKNKNTLSNLIVVVLTVVFYKYLPTMLHETTPTIHIYDAGSSALVSEIEPDAGLDILIYDSAAMVEDHLIGSDTPELGLVLPEDFDDRVEQNGAVVLETYLNHWVSDAQAEELVRLFENAVGQQAGRPAEIDIARNDIYPYEGTWGISVPVSIAILLAMTILGVTTVPHLMIEEKESKTLDALMVSPVTAGQLVAGKAIAGMAYSLAGATVALALNARVINHWGIAILAIVSTCLFSVALGLLLGTLLEVKQQIIAWGFLLMNILLVPAFLSIMPELLPQVVIATVSWMPTVMAAKVLRMSAWNHVPLGTSLAAIAVVMGWTVAVLLAVVWAVRRNDR